MKYNYSWWIFCRQEGPAIADLWRLCALIEMPSKLTLTSWRCLNTCCMNSVHPICRDSCLTSGGSWPPRDSFCTSMSVLASNSVWSKSKTTKVFPAALPILASGRSSCRRLTDLIFDLPPSWLSCRTDKMSVIYVCIKWWRMDLHHSCKNKHYLSLHKNVSISAELAVGGGTTTININPRLSVLTCIRNVIMSGGLGNTVFRSKSPDPAWLDDGLV